jgi:hypothetical protein
LAEIVQISRSNKLDSRSFRKPTLRNNLFVNKFSLITSSPAPPVFPRVRQFIIDHLDNVLPNDWEKLPGMEGTAESYEQILRSGGIGDDEVLCATDCITENWLRLKIR